MKGGGITVKGGGYKGARFSMKGYVKGNSKVRNKGFGLGHGINAPEHMAGHGG